jgi:hypothetical protein
MGAQVFRTDRRDYANTSFPQFCEFAWQHTANFPAGCSNNCSHACNLECTYFVIMCEWKWWVWQREREREREREHTDAFLQYQSWSPILQQLVLSFTAQSWKTVIRSAKEMVTLNYSNSWQVLWREYCHLVTHFWEVPFQSDGQEDAINSQLETLW